MNQLIIGKFQDVSGIDGAEMVFLDPPFNTGKNWGDYQDSMPLDKWLEMIQDAVMCAKKMLTDTGSLWMNVDEKYSHRVRVILDECMGADNWVSTVVWRKHYRASVSRSIKTMHDPIFVYSKTPGWRRRRGLPPSKDQIDKYVNPDHDLHGRWRKTHAGEKTYLNDLMLRGAMPTSWWDYDTSGHTEQARKESGGFATPKPEALLTKIITVSTDSRDLVVDLFAGSGTTGVAAYQLDRRFVLVEQRLETVQNYIVPRLRAVGANETAVTILSRDLTRG